MWSWISSDWAVRVQSTAVLEEFADQYDSRHQRGQGQGRQQRFPCPVRTYYMHKAIDQRAVRYTVATGRSPWISSRATQPTVQRGAAA